MHSILYVMLLLFTLDPEDPYKPSVRTRNLGLTVCKGTSVMLIYPLDGTQEIANPFLKDSEQPQ